MGIDGGGEEQPEGEGGQGGTRLGTIMPLVRGTGQVIIAVLAVLAVLGQIGVNVTPLLAGAGIVGVAVGFGAQTLVRDIISGVFFLIDDAFRKGEYIDIGSVTGTVEAISIRSMQLRHHNGPLHTIPFGEIRHLTNFSRDWVMMKLPLRVTYDTDVERLRKLIKRLGQDLLDDPELGPKFLQPLKSQGVIQMEDSAMIVRVKFMTRPGDQWTLRTKVFARIRELFEREGIKFAHREVTVRIADQEDGRPLREEEKEAVAAAARSAIELPAASPGRTEGRALTFPPDPPLPPRLPGVPPAARARTGSAGVKRVKARATAGHPGPRRCSVFALGPRRGARAMGSGAGGNPARARPTSLIARPSRTRTDDEKFTGLGTMSVERARLCRSLVCVENKANRFDASLRRFAETLAALDQLLDTHTDEAAARELYRMGHGNRKGEP